MTFRTLRITLLLLLIAGSASTPLVWLGNNMSDNNQPYGQVARAAASGPQRTILILVRFPDVTNSTSLSDTTSILASMNAYYSENSYGVLSFQFDISPAPNFQWYTMPNNIGYYGADTGQANSRLIEDALRAAYNAGVNLSNYRFATIVHSGNDEAITHVSNDIHSYTIPDFPFNPSPLTLIRISTSVLAETDPMGVYAHESGHLLGLPDLYDVTGQIDPANNFLGYWDLMSLGEWNPNTGNPLIQPGTFPAHMSVWPKVELGLVPTSRVVTIDSGESQNVTIQNLELPTSGFQAVKIPLAYNQDGSLTYYLIEMRAQLGTYDAHLPFPSSYPDAGLFIYKVNETIPTGQGSVRLIDAHPGGDLSDAGFGPCNVPCSSNNTFWDQANFVKIIVTTTTTSSYTVAVDRTSSPPFLLQVNTPSPGVLVSVDGQNLTSDSSNQLRLTVRYGPHTVYVETTIPISIGSTSVELGLSNRFVGWDDGGTNNPRGVSVLSDTVITAIYRVTIEPSFSLGVTALIIMLVVAAAATVYRHRARPSPAAPAPSATQEIALDPTKNERTLVPRDDRLSAGSDKDNDETKSSNP